MLVLAFYTVLKTYVVLALLKCFFLSVYGYKEFIL